MRERLLDTKQTAELLGVKEATLRDWVWRRKIPFVRIGGLVKFEPTAIDRFIQENRVEADRRAS